MKFLKKKITSRNFRQKKDKFRNNILASTKIEKRKLALTQRPNIL